ncbi:MAG: hypothetical protein QM786_08310 [Breznakibacter sp.]
MENPKESIIGKKRYLAHKFILIAFLSIVAEQEIVGQMPMLPIQFLLAPGGGGKRKKGDAPATLYSPKVLIDENTKSGKKDSIFAGSFVKIWLNSDTEKRISQPLMKWDFNKHTYYFEGQLISIGDSSLVFAKSQPPSILPPPLSLIPVLIKKRPPIESMFKPMFDTIMIHEVTKFRISDMALEGAMKGFTMMPAMTFLPEDFTTWPNILYFMPGTMIASNLAGTAIFSTHKVNETNGKHQLYIGDNANKNTLFPPKIKSGFETEWAYEQIDRWDRAKYLVHQQLLDNAMNEYRGNSIMSLTLSHMEFPSYVIGPTDGKTKVNIPDKQFLYGFTMENFITPRLRVGMEMQTHKLAASTGNAATGNVSGGMGFIFTNYSFLKFGIGDGLYSDSFKRRIRTQIEDLRDGAMNIEYDDNVRSRINLLRAKLLADPKPYFMFGAGAVNSTLMKIRGSNSGMSVKEYTQKNFSMTAGVGVLTRVGYRLTYDFSCNYVYSPDYSPTMGGLYSYSGINFKLNIGYMTGQSFSKMRKLYNQLSNEY